jgi:hypothetical protein
MRLYQEAVMILISLSSIWMAGTRLQGYRLSVGRRIERSKLDAGIQTERASVLASINRSSVYQLHGLSYGFDAKLQLYVL